MKIALLSIPQLRQLYHQELASGWFFNPIINKFGNVLITEEEINRITNSNFNWVKLLPLLDELDTRPPQNFTPPASNGIGLTIITRFQWVFPFRLNGFTIEMKDSNGTKYVEKSVLGWSEFTKELNKPQNDDLKLMLAPLIDYLRNTAVEITI
jgi:hypothetical protein